MGRDHVIIHLRTVLRHRARRIRRNDQTFGYVILGTPIGILATIWFATVSYSVGRRLPDGLLGASDLLFATLVVVPAAIVGLRAIQNVAKPYAMESALPTARHRDVVYAHLLLESLFMYVLVGVPGAVAGLAFAWGAGDAATAVLVTAAVTGAVVFGTCLGFVSGYALRTAFGRSRLLARVKPAVVVLVLFAVLVSMSVVDPEAVVLTALELLALSPIGGYADMSLFVVVPDASPMAAGVALGWTTVTCLLLARASSYLAAVQWYTTPIRPDSPTGSDTDLTLPGVETPTSHVVLKTWKRARRRLLRLLHVGYGAGILAIFIGSGLRDGQIPSTTVFLVVFYCAWATGSALTLNPLGEEWPVLPMTLTSTATGHQVVGGLWIAVALPGVLLSTVITLPVAVASPLGTSGVALSVVLAASLAALAPGLATGIGARFPKTEQVDIFRRQKAIIPSGAAFYVYSIALSLCTAPMWVALPGLSGQIASSVGFTSPTVRLGAILVAVVVLSGGAILSFSLATRRFASFTFG